MTTHRVLIKFLSRSRELSCAEIFDKSDHPPQSASPSRGASVADKPYGVHCAARERDRVTDRRAGYLEP